MRRRFLMILMSALVACGTTLPPSTGNAQDAKGEQSKDQAAERQTKPPSFYRVDYSVSELDHGKQGNTRNYTLKTGEGEKGNSSFRVGSRIPVSTGGQQFQYYDVGVNLDCWLRDYETYVWLRTKLELNSVAGSESANAASPPVIRRFQIEDVTAVAPGKSTLVGAIDDVVADRRYEITVKVEKIK